MNHVRKHRKFWTKTQKKKWKVWHEHINCYFFVWYIQVFEDLKLSKWLSLPFKQKKIKISYISMINAEKLHIKRTLVQILMKKEPYRCSDDVLGFKESRQKFITVPCYRSSILVLSTNINTANFKYFKCLLFPNLFSFVPVYLYF